MLGSHGGSKWNVRTSHVLRAHLVSGASSHLVSFSISPEPGMLGVPEIDLRLREGGDLPEVANVP